MAEQLLLDLYGCDSKMLLDASLICSAAHHAVKQIGAEIVEECVHQFEPYGVSYLAVISTSHFSIHTWPEYGYAAIDIFSCQEAIPQAVGDALAIQFGAKQHRLQTVERRISISPQI